MDSPGVIQAISRFYNLDPELIDIDVVTLMGTWGTLAAAQVNPVPFQFEPGYDHVIWGLGAFIQLNDDNNLSDNTRVEFNIFTSWENKQIFTRALNFGAFTSTQGSANPIYLLPGFKKLQDRTRINVKFTPSEFDNGWLGSDIQLGVLIYGARLNLKDQG
jgi:hypothetical protein